MFKISDAEYDCMKLPLLLLLLFLPSLVHAGIEECGGMQSENRDGCILQDAKTQDECMGIASVWVRERCFVAIAEERAKTYSECNNMFLDYQKICYARLVFQTHKNKDECSSLAQDFQETCFVYYAIYSSPGDIAACDRIQPYYKEACLNQFFKKNLVKSESDCKNYDERYLDACKSYFSSTTNAHQIALGILASVWNFLTSSTMALILAGAAFLFVFAAALYIFLKGRKRN
jgi:hypothetical protein